jgi:assimilatory nitrate reductase catalytic subunit
VPFSNNTPLADRGRERSGVLFRAASHETPPDEVLAALERIFGLDAPDVLRYADRKKGQRRTMRLVRNGGDAHLAGFVLAGDTSAQAWIRTLLQDELAAQSYGRLLLLPGAKPPVAVQSRGKPVCTCFNVSDMAIDEHLALLSRGGGGGGHLGTDEERLASLQATLKCGTNCGSCVPELKRRVRSVRTEAPVLTAAPRTVIPIRQVV